MTSLSVSGVFLVTCLVLVVCVVAVFFPLYLAGVGRGCVMTHAMSLDLHLFFSFHSPSLLRPFPPVCALEGLLFCDVISLTHVRVPLLSPMTVILGLTHPSSLIYDMTSSSLTCCILSCP